MEFPMTQAQTIPAPHGADALAEAFERLGSRIGFSREQEVYAQDDPAEVLYRVVSGVVRTTRLTPDGRRLIGDFYYPGDIFGLEPGPDHQFGAEALTDCQVLTVRRGAMIAYAGDAEVDRAILAATRRELERLQDHLMVLGRKGARERVASFLMSLASRETDEHVDLPMSRQDMADYLGLTIETVSRMLTQLQGEAVVAFPSTRRFRVRRWDVLEALAA
jgi:CRP/FNR family nitrogen fixation transcriptional regulator